MYESFFLLLKGIVSQTYCELHIHFRSQRCCVIWNSILNFSFVYKNLFILPKNILLLHACTCKSLIFPIDNKLYWNMKFYNIKNVNKRWKDIFYLWSFLGLIAYRCFLTTNYFIEPFRYICFIYSIYCDSCCVYVNMCDLAIDSLLKTSSKD